MLKRRRKSTLFRRYFKASAVTVLGAFLFFGMMLMIFVSGQWWTDKVDTLTRNARNISASYSEFLSEDSNQSKNFLKSTLNIMSQATVSDYFISGLDGEIILCADGKGLVCEKHNGLHVSKEHMQNAVSGGFSDYATLDEFGEGRFLVAVPVKNEGETVAVVFAVEDAITGLLPYVSTIFMAMIIIMLFALVLVFVSIFRLTKSITDPLSEMEEVTSSIAKGDFSYRVNVNFKDRDMTEFGAALNKMADELAIEEKSRRSFVANVSHELKTPMTSIGGFIDGILDGTIEPEKEAQYLKIVSDEVKRLSRLVTGMLNMSKLEAGELDIKPQTFDISEMIFRTLLGFEQILEKRHIDIRGLDTFDANPLTADKDMINQVVYNLVDNAVKFTPEGGYIEVSSKRHAEKIIVKIRNSGKGIPSEEIDKIFERFYKVDKTRSFDVKGAGMGLYLCKTIIELHGGQIAARSEQGEYAEFIFQIPIN